MNNIQLQTYLKKIIAPLALLYIFFSLFSTCAVGAATISFNGLTEFEKSKLKKKIPAAFTQKATQYDGNKAIKYLMSIGDFEQITLLKISKKRYTLKAVRTKQISQVIVEDQNQIPIQGLSDIVGIKENQLFDRKLIVEAGKRLQKYFGQQGFLSSQVSVEVVEDSTASRKIIFSVLKGTICKIIRLNIETENFPLKKTLTNRLKKYINKSLSQAILSKISKDAGALLQKNRYLKGHLERSQITYNPSKSEAYLTYKIESPYRYEVYFEGYAPPQTKSDLFRAINLRDFDRTSLSPARNIVEKIRSYYLKSGYANVRINHSTTADQKNYKRKIKIKIHEGQKVKIDRIILSGHLSRSSKFYEKFILENSSNLISKGYYNRDDLKIGYENLITDLRNQGFLHASIRAVRIDFNKKQNKATISIELSEGPLTQIRKISFKGNKKFSKFELIKQISLTNNSPLHLKELEESIELIRGFYLQNGYLEAAITNEKSDLISYNKSGTQANILFKIYEGPQIIIKDISIEGNRNADPSVVLRESQLEVGQILTPDNIGEARSRLNKLGLFSNVDIETSHRFSKVSQRTIIIKVTEDQPGTFKLGAGITNEDEKSSVRGFTGLSYVWGSSRALGSRIELSKELSRTKYLSHKITVGYLEPFLLDSSWNGRVNLTRNVFTTDYYADENVGTVVESNKLALLIEKNITSNLQFTWNFWTKDLRRSFLTDPNKTVITDSGAPIENTAQSIATIGPLVDYDKRDNPFMPTQGYLLRWGLDYSNPEIGSTSNIHFYRTQAEARKYLKLGPSVTWANVFRTGYGKNLNSKIDSGIPISYAYFLGGLSTIRGFGGNTDAEKIPNKTEFNTDSFSNDLVVQDSTGFYLIKSEFRFSISGPFGVVLFYDAGEVRVSGYDFKKPFRQTYGIGFRYNTPVGPISFDIGFKVDPGEDEADSKFHISFGTF